MDTIIVVNEFLKEGLVLFQHLVTHVRNVVKECLILHLWCKNIDQESAQEDCNQNKMQTTNTNYVHGMCKMNNDWRFESNTVILST